MSRNVDFSNVKMQVQFDNSRDLIRIGELLGSATINNNDGNLHDSLVELGWIKIYIEGIYKRTEQLAKQDGERK